MEAPWGSMVRRCSYPSMISHVHFHGGHTMIECSTAKKKLMPMSWTIYIQRRLYEYKVNRQNESGYMLE